jgi:hypothetical protein
MNSLFGHDTKLIRISDVSGIDDKVAFWHASGRQWELHYMPDTPNSPSPPY